jgi:ABC-type molybdate transport system ATPase subunit
MDLLEIDIALVRRSFELRAALNLGAETVAIIGPSGAGKTSRSPAWNDGAQGAS